MDTITIGSFQIMSMCKTILIYQVLIKAFISNFSIIIYSKIKIGFPYCLEFFRCQNVKLTLLSIDMDKFSNTFTLV